MLWRLLRWLVLVLVGLAFLGGTTIQALPPSNMAVMGKASATPMPGCAKMASSMAQDTDTPTPVSPHKGITPDCVKLTQCLGVPDLPMQPQLAQATVAYVAIAYWRPVHLLDGLSPVPAPFPSRSA